LKLFDGCPAPYDTRKKLVVPAALRPLRLAAQRAYCSLGEVQENVGWKYRAVVRRLEDARKLKAYKWHLQQKAARKNEKLARRAAAKDPKLAPFSALLKQYGA
jgi:large subunit ribosomal protein L13Ae